MIQLRVFGALELTQEGGAQVLSVLSQPKRAALLAYLALSRGLRRRDELLALFWPEQDTEHARAALRQSIYFLRRSLGEELLVARGDEEVGVERSHLWCDAVTFEERLEDHKWEAALEIYDGDLLPAFSLEGCGELVDWFDAERDRLRRAAAAAARQLTDAQQKVPALAAVWARRVLLHAPLEESAVRRCMELLHASGDAAGALQVFEEYAQRLQKELELEPSEALREFAAGLRTAPPASVTVSDVVPAPMPASPPLLAPAPSPSPVAPTALVAPAPVRSLAVLPFVSMSAHQDDQFFSDGLTDEVTTALAKIDGLRVSSRTSAFSFKNMNMDVREIGRQLSVAAVLEGSVQRAGKRVRVNVQLIECAGGYHLWSQRWDTELDDIFAIQDEIAANVGRVLRLLLLQQGETRWPRLPRTNVTAYEKYLRGREFFHQTRQRSLMYAREMFEQAIAEDPEYALAHAALAETIALGRMYYPAQESDLPAADRASLRALELDPTLAEAHSARASVLFVMERYEEAERSFRAAMRLEPQLFEAAYFYARMCVQLGRMEEALALFQQAYRIRDDYQDCFFTAQTLEALHRHDEAKAQYEQALHAAATHLQLHPDDARAATMCAVALMRLGRRDEAFAWGRRATEIDPMDAGVRYNVACMYAVAGDAEGALEMVESAVKAGFGNRGWLDQDPDLDIIRDHPRFQALMALTHVAGS